MWHLGAGNGKRHTFQPGGVIVFFAVRWYASWASAFDHQKTLQQRAEETHRKCSKIESLHKSVPSFLPSCTLFRFRIALNISAAAFSLRTFAFRHTHVHLSSTPSRTPNMESRLKTTIFWWPTPRPRWWQYGYCEEKTAFRRFCCKRDPLSFMSKYLPLYRSQRYSVYRFNLTPPRP